MTIRDSAQAGPEGGDPRTLAVLAALPALALFALWPLGGLLRRVLAPAHGSAGDVIADLVGDSLYLEHLLVSAGEALAATAIALALGLPAAWALSHVRFPGRSAVRAVIVLPLLLPALAIAFGLERTLVPESRIGDLAAWFGFVRPGPLSALALIVAAQGLFGVAVVVRVVSAAWLRSDRRTVESARLLGVGTAASWRSGLLPGVRSAVIAAAALTFLHAFAGLAVILALDAGEADTVEALVFGRTAAGAELGVTALLALIQIAVTATAVLAYAGGEGYRATLRARRGVAPPPPAERRASRALAILPVVLALIVLAPIFTLADQALTTDASGVTGRHFRDLFTGEDAGLIAVGPAFVRAAAVAASAALVAMLGGWLASLALPAGGGVRGTGGRLLLLLPMAIPAATLSLGYLPGIAAGPGREAELALLVVVHAAIVYPVVVRGLMAVPGGSGRRPIEAMRLLGASRWRAWRQARFPAIAAAMSIALLVAFAWSLGEAGAATLVAGGDDATAAVALLQSIVLSEDGRAAALAVILLATTAALSLSIEAVRYRWTADL